MLKCGVYIANIVFLYYFYILKQKNMKMKKVIDSLVSVGAAIVIFGAWAKLTHQSYADTMLTIGLFTECIIFLVYAFTDWFKGKFPNTN